MVGDVGLDAEDMVGELAMLRRTATSLEPGGVRSKLLVPNEQIKYLTINTPNMDAAARLEAAKAALDGATPYAVDDLAFDISVDSNRTHIAAVARETLAEAEAFAVEHRFYPVSFAAIPADQPYLGEPFFGQTEAATALLEDGETVEADGIAVVIIGDVKLPDDKEAEAEAEADTGGFETEDAASAQNTEAGSSLDEPVEEAGSVDEVVSKADTDDTPTKNKMPEIAAQPKTPGPENVLKDTTSGDDKATAASPSEKHKPADVTPSDEVHAAVPVMASASKPAGTDLSAKDGNASPALSPDTKQPEVKQPLAPSVLAAASGGLVPKVSSPAPVLGAASRGAPAPYVGKPNGAISTSPSSPAFTSATLDKQTGPSGAVPPTIAAPTVAPTSNTAPPVPAPPAGFASRRGPDLPLASAAKPDLKPATRVEPSMGSAKTSAAPAIGASVGDPSVPKAGETIKPDSSSLAASTHEPAKTTFLSRRKAKAPAPIKPALPARKLAPDTGVAVSEADRMTVFGARRKDVGGKPRFLGLILTAALLVFLAGVAAWASVFMDDGLSLSRLFGDRSPRATASIPDIPNDVPKDAPKAVEADVRTASLDPGLTEEDGAVLDALSAPVSPPAEDVTEAEAEAKYAATGIWARAPEMPPEPAGVIDLENLYITSIDPVSTSSDAVALPALNSYLTDVAFGSVSSPAAAGTQFAYDPRGLIIPTPQGALSPDGFTVFLGRPDVIPVGLPNRSEDVAQAPGPDADAEIEAEDTALANARPRLRPADLSETNERAQLDGLTRSELAGLRPSLRPASVQQQAAASAAAVEAPAPEAPAIDTGAAVAVALAEAPAPAPVSTVANATQFAVRASVRPDTRPRNFARIVKRAERAAPVQQETRVASTASVAPRAVTPSIPSSASVARQATVKNAIKLRDVNLIGVYGKPSSRRALIRLGNGRYQKVVVGDRIDGGRVSAIGDSELRYTKRGRDVVLRIPN